MSIQISKEFPSWFTFYYFLSVLCVCVCFVETRSRIPSGEDNRELLIILPLPPQVCIRAVHQQACSYEALGVRPRVSCMWGKHSLNRAISPSQSMPQLWTCVGRSKGLCFWTHKGYLLIMQSSELQRHSGKQGSLQQVVLWGWRMLLCFIYANNSGCSSDRWLLL